MQLPVCTSLVNRDKEGQHRKGHVGKMQRWMEAAHSTHIMDHFDVHIPEAEAKHKLAAAEQKVMPNEAFHCKGGNYSLGLPSLKELADPAWVSPTPDIYRTSSLATELLLFAKAEGSFIHTAWRSLLCGAGLVVVKQLSDPSKAYIILDTSKGASWAGQWE